MCTFQALREEAEIQRLASTALEKELPEAARKVTTLVLKKGAEDALAAPDLELQHETAAMADALASATMAETEAVKEVPSCVPCLW